MDAARQTGNSEAVRQLEAIAPYAATGRPIPIKDLYVQREWVGYFGGAWVIRTSNRADGDLAAITRLIGGTSGMATISLHRTCFLTCLGKRSEFGRQDRRTAEKTPGLV